MKALKPCVIAVLLCTCLGTTFRVQGQAVDPFYSGMYSLRTLVNIPGVPRGYGGVLIRTNNPDLLLVAGDCEAATAKIYQIQVLRGADGHITNFVGTPIVLANAPGGPTESGPPWTGLQGDWDFGPGDVLFYISPDNYLSQIKPGSTVPSKQTDLGVATGLIAGTVVVVPPGLPGAGRLKLLTRHHQFWFDVPYSSDGAGTYNVGPPNATVEVAGTAFIGAAFVPAGAPKFANASVVVCDGDKLRTYEVNGTGDPIAASGRVFVTGLSEPEGISRDPATGDFIFTSADQHSPGFYILGNLAGTPVPTISLLSPTNGTFFAAPAGFYLVAQPSAPGGTIASVKFYQNQTLLSTVITPPYETFVSSLPAGAYDYWAVLTDGIGRMATSTVARVTATNAPANVPPSVALTNPPNNSMFYACVNVVLGATASDADGYVESVAFYDGFRLLGQATSSPYRWSVNNLAGGPHALTARATDDQGVTRTSAVVNVTILAPPTNTLIATLGTNGECEACFSGAPGSNYVFVGTTNIISPITWRRVETNTSPTGVIRFVDRASTNLPRSFYRAELLR